MVWNFELYMLPCTLLLLFARSAIVEHRKGRLGKSFSSLGDETISAVVQAAPIDEEMLESETATKVNGFKSFQIILILLYRNKRNQS